VAKKGLALGRVTIIFINNISSQEYPKLITIILFLFVPFIPLVPLVIFGNLLIISKGLQNTSNYTIMCVNYRPIPYKHTGLSPNPLMEDLRLAIGWSLKNEAFYLIKLLPINS
jgi:hypothetical protein